MKYKVSITLGLSIAAVLLSIVSTFGIVHIFTESFHARSSAYKSNLDEAENSARFIVPILDNTFLNAIKLQETAVTIIRNYGSLKKALEGNLPQVISEHIKGDYWIKSVCIIDKDGAVRYSSYYEDMKHTHKESFLQEQLQGKSSFIVSYPPNNSSHFGKNNLILSVSIHNNGHFEGVVALEMKYTYFQEHLLPYLEGAVEGLALVNRQKSVLAVVFSDYSQDEKMVGLPIDQLEGFSELKTAKMDVEGGVRYKGENKFFTEVSLNQMPLDIVMMLDKGKIEQQWKEESLYPMITATLLILFATVTALGFIIRQAISAKTSIEKLNAKVAESMEEIRKKDTIIYEQQRRSSIQRLLIDIAHHWRQPLNNCAVEIQLIEDIIDDCANKELIKEYISGGVTELKGLSDTISRLTYFYENEVQKKTDLIDALRQTDELFEKTLKSSDMKIKYEISPDFVIKADTDQWVELFSILILNVKDAANRRNLDNVEIFVKAYMENTQGVIVVEDNAGGIDAELLPDKVFEPYTTTGFKSRNKGLGLYIASNIVSYALKGSVAAENGAAGARIIIKIPLD